MKKRNSLMFKVPFYVSLVIFVLGVFATVIVYYFSQNQIIENEKNNLITISEEQTEKTTEIMNCSVTLAESISVQDEIIDYVNEFDKNYQNVEILKILEKYNIGEKYSAIYIMDKNGNTLVSTNESFVGKNYSFRDYFKTALTGTSFVDVSIGVTSGELGYYFASPIFSEDNIIGVVVSKLNPEHINSTLDVSTQRGELNIMFVDEYGVIIYSNKKETIYSSLGELTILDKKEISEKRRYEGKEIKPLDYIEIQNKLDVTRETSLYEIYDEIDKEDEIITVSKLGKHPFYVVIEEHTAHLIENSSRVGFYLGLLVFFSAITASVLILVILREALKPIKEITQGIEEISKGNYDYKVEVDKKDEFGKFAEILNKMSARIKQSRENIEEKVQERTERLEKMNSLMVGREKKMISLKEEIKKLKGGKK